MYRNLLALVLILVFGSSVATAQPRWSGTPIEGGVVSSMIRGDGGKIWANAGGAMFAGEDFGTTWVRRSTGMKWRTRFLDRADNGTLFAAQATLGTARIYRSTDEGASWTESAGPGPVGVQAFAVTPGNAAVWMFVNGNDLWRTTNSGAAWSIVAGAPDNPLGPRCQPGSALVCLCGSRTEEGIFKTFDAGAGWASSSTGLPGGLRFDDFEFDPATPSIVYAVAQTGGGIFKSTDSGASWTPASTGLPVDLRDIDDLAITLEAPDQLVVLVEKLDGTRQLFESLNAGASWSFVHTFLGTEPRTIERALPRAGAALVVVGTDRGIQRSTDSGVSFAPSNSGFEAGSPVRLTAHSSSPSWIYAHGSAQGPYVSNDGGDTWVEKTVGLPGPGALNWALAVTPDDPERAVLAKEDDFYLTANGGDTWSRQHADLAPFGDCGFFPSNLTFSIDSNDLWVGHQGCHVPIPRAGGASTSPEVLVSLDEGAGWTPLFDLPPSTGTTFGLPVGRFIVHPSNPDIALVSSLLGPTSQTVVRRTLNRGSNWTITHNEPATVGYLAMAPSDPTRIYLGLDGFETGGGITDVLKSGDTGATWAPLGTSFPCITSIVVDFEDPDTLWVACETVHQSLDGGDTWTDLGTEGLPDPVAFLWLEVFRIGGGKVLMATTNVGIFSYSLDGVFKDGFESGDFSAWSSPK